MSDKTLGWNSSLMRHNEVWNFNIKLFVIHLALVWRMQQFVHLPRFMPLAIWPHGPWTPCMTVLTWMLHMFMVVKKLCHTDVFSIPIHTWITAGFSLFIRSVASETNLEYLQPRLTLWPWHTAAPRRWRWDWGRPEDECWSVVCKCLLNSKDDAWSRRSTVQI